MAILSQLNKPIKVSSSNGEKFTTGWISDRVARLFRRETESGFKVSEETAMFNSAVFACQRAVSESFAMLPREIVKKEKDNTRTTLDDHPSVKCLKKQANPIMTAYKFYETLQHHVMSYGNAYAELQFENNSSARVIRMWPIPPTRVRPEIVINDSNELDIVYHVTLKDGKETTLQKDRILHIPGLGFNGLIGYPVIEYMLNTIGLSQAVESYASKFFKQGASIPGYISVPDSFNEQQIENLRKHNAINNEGLDAAHRWKFTYESAKFTPSGATPNDAQMIPLRIFQIQEIARWYRIPLHKIQELSHKPSHNNLEQLNIEFVTDTLMPPNTNWEQELERKFFRDPQDAGLTIKTNFNALLRGDSVARANFYRTMVMSGLMTRNEGRALEDLPPKPGGDDLMIPANMIETTTEREADARERIQD